jgi:TRAP-type mannitol/chloroaromatic compound transport system permease large subunit
MAESHNARMTSWVTVALIILGSILLGFALPMESVVLGIAGGVALLAGVITGFAFRIMDDYY